MWLNDRATCPSAAEHRIGEAILKGSPLTLACRRNTSQRCGLADADSWHEGEPDRQILEAQTALDLVLDCGFVAISGRPIRALLFFKGVRAIVRFLYNGAIGERLRHVIAAENGLDVGGISSRTGDRFEFLNVKQRAEIIRCLPPLLKAWPHEFARYCTVAKVARRSLLFPLKVMLRDAPYWYADALVQCFPNQSPTRSKEELACIVRYVQSRGGAVPPSVRKMYDRLKCSPRHAALFLT
jgi:hypothetical protein